jgi:hypothetical protein
MVGVLVAAAGILGFTGYELFFVKNFSRREPVWEKLDEKSSVEARSREGIRQVACGPAEVDSAVLPPKLTQRSSLQSAADVESTEDYPHNTWEDKNCYWIVICKNRRFHHKQTRVYNHKIPLAETDPFEELPVITSKLVVHCDECGEEYSYRPEEVLRYELNAPESFMPHPLFK